MNDVAKWRAKKILTKPTEIFTCSVIPFLTEGTGSSFFFLHKQWLIDDKYSIHLCWLNIADLFFELTLNHNFFLSDCNHYTSFSAVVQIYPNYPHLKIIIYLSMYLYIYLYIYFLVFCELKLFFPHISKRIVLLVIQFFSQISCLRRTLPEIQYLKQCTDLILFTFGTMFIAK